MKNEMNKVESILANVLWCPGLAGVGKYDAE